MVSSVEAAPPWSGRLVLQPGLFVYLGPGGAAESHAHHAVQLAWSLDHPLRLVVGARAIRARAVLVPANTTHALDADGRSLVLMLVERHGSRGVRVDEVARRALGEDVVTRLRDVPPPPSNGRSKHLGDVVRRDTRALGVPPTVTDELRDSSWMVCSPPRNLWRVLGAAPARACRSRARASTPRNTAQRRRP